jgi:hypothetical protein
MLRRYAYGWVTGGFFLISLTGHWLFAWFAYADTQREHGASVIASEYVVETLRDTLENWQSEFLQLLTFVVLTTYLIHRGSHESKDTDEKVQAQLDRIEQRLTSLSRSERDGVVAPAGGRGADNALRGPAPGTGTGPGSGSPRR